MAQKQVIDPLVADIMTGMMASTHAMTNRVIENLTEDRDRALALVAAIRDGVLNLIEGDSMPTPRAIERALWPSDKAVAEYLSVPQA